MLTPQTCGGSILWLDPEAALATHVVYSEPSHIPAAAALPKTPHPSPRLVTLHWVKTCVAENRVISQDEWLSHVESEEEEERSKQQACPVIHQPERKSVRRTYDDFQAKDRDQGLEIVQWMEHDYDWKGGKMGFIKYWLERKVRTPVHDRYFLF